MAQAKCLTCKGSAEAKTYEEAAEAIQHGQGSRKCPGGPGAKIAYVDSKGSLTRTMPKTSSGSETVKKPQESTTTVPKKTTAAAPKKRKNITTKTKSR